MHISTVLCTVPLVNVCFFGGWRVGVIVTRRLGTVKIWISIGVLEDLTEQELSRYVYIHNYIYTNYCEVTWEESA